MAIERKHPNIIYSNNKSVQAEKSITIHSISSSIKIGLVGFFVVQCAIILTKIIAVTINAVEFFKLGANDFIIPLWGFIIFSFITFASKNKNCKSH